MKPEMINYWVVTLGTKNNIISVNEFPNFDFTDDQK